MWMKQQQKKTNIIIENKKILIFFRLFMEFNWFIFINLLEVSAYFGIIESIKNNNNKKKSRWWFDG